MVSPKAPPAARISAANAILDRGFGNLFRYCPDPRSR
jgi:hypothetical protein